MDSDVPSYLHELILRQKLGAEFDAEFYIVDQLATRNQRNDFFYFEFKGIITNAAIRFGVGQLSAV